MLCRSLTVLVLGVQDAEVMPPVVPGAGVPQPQPAAGFGVEEVHVEPAVVAPAANEEKAIVVYKPADAARNLLLGPLRPGVPLIVSPEWIHGFKSTCLPPPLFLVISARELFIFLNCAIDLD